MSRVTGNCVAGKATMHLRTTNGIPSNLAVDIRDPITIAPQGAPTP
jgi:hypothetical protein